jgi:hypothetical protein
MRFSGCLPQRLSWLGMVLIVFSASSHAQCVAIGAIRWDAWYGGAKGAVGQFVERSLSHNEFRHRAPFCSQQNASGKLVMDCTSPAAIDKEIGYAQAAGLDYWAFLTYPSDDPMNLAFERYLESAQRSKLNFSLILTPASLTQPPGSQPKNLERFADYVLMPNYQHVMGKRPLVFLFPAGDLLSNAEKLIWLKKTTSIFRKNVQTKGGANPYLVLMDFNPIRGQKLALEIGFDAVSTYAIHGNGKGAPYNALATEARGYWDRAKYAGAKVVPTAMAGWDRRPRVLEPIPWEKGITRRSDEIDYFYVSPSPLELADHVAAAATWVHDNPAVAEANTVLVYAWNENDEGGWLVPTIGEGAARVNAMGTAISNQCPAKKH